MDNKNWLDKADNGSWRENVALATMFRTIVILTSIIVLFILGYIIVNISKIDGGGSVVAFLMSILAMFGLLVFVHITKN